MKAEISIPYSTYIQLRSIISMTDNCTAYWSTAPDAVPHIHAQKPVDLVFQSEKDAIWFRLKYL